MRNRFQLSAIVAFLLVSMIAVPSSSQTNTVLDLTAARTARAQRSERPGESVVDAMPVALAEAGVIAYVRRSTNDIHVISPDGTGDEVLCAYPGPTFLWAPQDLAWRPDGRELAFSSEHEETCSRYQSDVYAIRYNGAGLRRITNAPTCAELATLPKGSVEVNVTNQAGSWALVYVAGAPASRYAEDGTMTFDNVADFGPGVLQPAVGIYGERRTEAYPPLADVQPGATVQGGNLTISAYGGSADLGTGDVSWNADGSALAYNMRTFSFIRQIPANPSYGSIGEELPVVEDAVPTLVAWGPTAATADQYLYFSKDNWEAEGIEGIYLNSVGDDSGGTMLMYIDVLNGQYVHDIEWLPDGSGFLFSATYVDLGIFCDIFRYDFGNPPTLTQLTSLPDDQGARAFSISPSGQEVVFEWLPDIYDETSSLWITDSDGSSGPRWFADDAGRPAWGPAYVPEPVHADFVGTPTSGVRPLLVQFTNQSTGDYDTCTWTFGDGNTSTSCGNPTHTYAAKGVYTVALTVTGPGGTDTRTRTGAITVYEPVQAAFAGSPTAGVPPLTVTFTNQSTGDYDTCAWTFGDGGTSTVCSNPTYTYATKAVYTVALNVSGPGGTHTQTRDQYIRVQDEYLVYVPLVLTGH